jgi:hypothetical protein
MKRTINTRNALESQRKHKHHDHDQEKDNQHNKCISGTKKRAHEHHNHDQLKRKPSKQEMHQQHQEKSL